MLHQILVRTPSYVWILLAFLIYRGWLASRDREMPLFNIFVIPAVMLGLSLNELLNRFGLHSVPLLCWGAGLLAGTAIAARLAAPVSADRAKGTISQQGSWVPLVTMLMVFIVKYATAVTFAVKPALAASAVVALPVALLFGLMNGALAGRVLPALQAWRQAPRAEATAAC
jgi:hypothetical protein